MSPVHESMDQVHGLVDWTRGLMDSWTMSPVLVFHYTLAELVPQSLSYCTR